MSRRTATWLAWSLWALTFALTALSLILLALNLAHPDTHVFDWWLGNALVVIDVTVGAIVASRRPENPVGWLLCLSGVSVSTSSFTSQYAIYALLVLPGSLPAGEAVAWIAAWQLPVMIGLQVTYLLLFPTGRLPSGRWRPLAWLTVAFVVVGVILSAFSSDAYLGSLDPIRNPLGIEGFTYFWAALLYTVAPLLYVAVGLIGVCATAPGSRGRAPADQMVRLRRRDIRLSYRPERRHPGDRRTTLGRVGEPGDLPCRGYNRSHRARYSHPALQALRHRPPDQPHPRLRLPHR